MNVKRQEKQHIFDKKLTFYLTNNLQITTVGLVNTYIIMEDVINRPIHHTVISYSNIYCNQLELKPS